MRIIAGTHKGRVIESPEDRSTRPTTDRVREAIFSSVYSKLGDLAGVHVLDAFAGSGAMGMEALSRGASSCLFIERDERAMRVLEGNLKKLGIDGASAHAARMDAFDDPVPLRSARTPFDLVFLDPPYACEPASVSRLLEKWEADGLLGDGCLAVYEHSSSSDAEALRVFDGADAFDVCGQKKYGKISVMYLQRRRER